MFVRFVCRMESASTTKTMVTVWIVFFLILRHYLLATIIPYFCVCVWPYGVEIIWIISECVHGMLDTGAWSGLPRCTIHSSTQVISLCLSVSVPFFVFVRICFKCAPLFELCVLIRVYEGEQRMRAVNTCNFYRWLFHSFIHFLAHSCIFDVVVMPSCVVHTHMLRLTKRKRHQEENKERKFKLDEVYVLTAMSSGN